MGVQAQIKHDEWVRDRVCEAVSSIEELRQTTKGIAFKDLSEMFEREMVVSAVNSTIDDVIKILIRIFNQ